MSSHKRTPPGAAFHLGAGSWALAAALAFSQPASAEPAPPFDELLRQAQVNAPRVLERQAEVRAAEGRASQAAARPNPSVNLEVENFAGQRPYDAFSATETTLGVSQSIELGGKRGARIGAARAEIDVARARQSQTLADLGYDLATAYGDAEVAELRVTVANEALELARTDARVARALVDAGREAELRIVQADAGVSAASADLDAAKAERAAALSRLSAAAGSSSLYTGLAGSVLDQPDIPQTAVLARGAPSPAVVTAEAEREAAARRIRIERLRSRPDVTVSVGVRRFGDEGASALVAGVSAPIPLFDRNRGATAAAVAELQAADARLAAARLEAEAELRIALAQVDASTTRLEAAKTGEVSAAEAYRLARIGYESGRLPLAELLTSRRLLAEARGRSLEAFTARLRAQAAIARLQGRTPFGTNP